MIAKNLEITTLGGGCFWCLEPVFDELKGVVYRVLFRDSPYLRPAKPEDMKSVPGWNFESFDELSDALWKLIRMLKKQQVEEKDIVIDFTGGQKVTSVVAAAITINRHIDAQYVQTNSPWEVLSYDVIQVSADTGDLNL